MGKDWIPTLEEYNPGITKEQWIELVQDRNVFTENALITFACIQKAKIATCADMVEEFGRGVGFYNTNNWQTGKRVYEKTQCLLSERDEGGNRFWSVCCLGRPAEKNRWEFQIRPELQDAFNETGVLEGVEVMAKKTFTWIPFYMEMADKLLAYKNNREELVKIVYGLDRQFVSYIRDDNGNDYHDIDPFSVFAIFNRTITEENRKKICTYFKEKLEISSEIPNDFDSIPVMNNQLSVFVWRQHINTDTQPLWDLFSSICTNDSFVDLFDVVRNQQGVKWNVTMAMFWVRPYDYMPLDANSRNYLEKIGIQVFDEKKLNGNNYLELVKTVKEKINNQEITEKSIPEISYNAWLKEPHPQGEIPMSEDLITKYTELLKKSRNLILTGAPGTGKTYLAQQIAEKMDCEKDNIGFVQFHPSYDYTDFVEGLRPKQNDNTDDIGFERKDGVFKEFCAKALKNLEDSKKTVDVLQHEKTINEVFEDFLNTAIEEKTKFETISKNDFYIDSFTDKKVFITIPKNEKANSLTISIDEILELVNNKVQLNIGKDVSDYFKRKWRTHQDSYIFVLAKNILEIVNKNTNKGISSVEKVDTKPFVFIIDEINRGEVAKIFGELFFSVDPGYRITGQDLEDAKAGTKTITTIKTQYANLESDGNDFDRALGTKDYGHFFIPENVYIIGTMNDIDRSVESMDFAFRRRFTWAEIEAKDTQYMLDSPLGDRAEQAKEKMNRLNEAISAIPQLNSAYHIGASYFLKLQNFSQDNCWENLWHYHLEGILKEYLRGNPQASEELARLKAAYEG